MLRLSVYCGISRASTEMSCLIVGRDDVRRFAMHTLLCALFVRGIKKKKWECRESISWSGCLMLCHFFGFGFKEVCS